MSEAATLLADSVFIVLVTIIYREREYAHQPLPHSLAWAVAALVLAHVVLLERLR